MSLEIPNDDISQDIYNRQVDEVLTALNDKLDYIKSIPDDGSITTVAEIIDYLRSM